MRKKTLILLIMAVLLGAAASVATYDLLRGSPSGHKSVSSDDQDPGLIP